MRKPAVYSNSRKKYTYSIWRKAEFRNVKVDGTGNCHHGLKTEKVTIFVVCLFTSEN